MPSVSGPLKIAQGVASAERAASASPTNADVAGTAEVRGDRVAGVRSTAILGVSASRRFR
ncbi:MAG: hypothetical protein DCC68_00915 [Planctomycetota bacterium]|nr:MAG: hypothetical protein DCC68_00915 [Planctomycetota bacterium]